MNKLFSNGAKTVIGLDVGSYSTKAVQLTLNPTQTKLDAYGEVLTGALNLNNPHTFSDMVQRVLKNPNYGAFTGDYLVIKLPQQYVDHQVVTIDNPRKRTFLTKNYQDRQIRRSAKTSNTSHIDYEVLTPRPNKANKLTYLVATIPEDVVLTIKYSLAENKLGNFQLGSNIAAIKTTIAAGSTYPSHYLDIGHHSSRYTYFNNDIYMHHDSPFGTDDFAQHLAGQLGTDTAQAHSIVKANGFYGGEHAAKARLSLQKSSAKLVDSLSAQIASNNNVFGNAQPNNSILVIYGAIGTIPGLTSYLADLLNIPVVLPQPWAQTSIYPLKPIPKQRLPIYSTAIGLAMSAR